MMKIKEKLFNKNNYIKYNILLYNYIKFTY